jgi:aryl-alcohol dehydrogenase-like predicted oxidoreductase
VDTTNLGDGLTVGALGYGAMGLADVYGPADEAESLATLHHALDIGVTLIDTADIYGDGSNACSPTAATRSSWPRSSASSLPTAIRAPAPTPRTCARPVTPA